jgi:hypothetical protein
MNNKKLEQILATFWNSKHRDTIYYLGKCADVSIALQKFLGAGELFLVGSIPNSNIAWHTVLHYNNAYWDIRGANTLQQLRQRNPIAQFCDDNHIVKRANPQEINHIIKLLNPAFVQDTINGLKQAEKMVK